MGIRSQIGIGVWINGDELSGDQRREFIDSHWRIGSGNITRIQICLIDRLGFGLFKGFFELLITRCIICPERQKACCVLVQCVSKRRTKGRVTTKSSDHRK